MDYKDKYLKYKTKYLKLKNIDTNNQIGGGKINFIIIGNIRGNDLDNLTFESISDGA